MEKYHVECACEALQHHLCVHLFANVLAVSCNEMDTHALLVLSELLNLSDVNSGKNLNQNVISVFSRGMNERNAFLMSEIQAFECV